MVEAVIFDLDGVLLDSEQLWQQSKEAFVRATGGRWRDDAPRDMLGMSSTEWSRYMHDALDVPLSQEEIYRGVVARMEVRYRSGRFHRCTAFEVKAQEWQCEQTCDGECHLAGITSDSYEMSCEDAP